MIGIEEFKSDGGEGREWQWSRADCKRVLVAAEWTVEGAGQKQRDPLGVVAVATGRVGAWSWLDVWVAVVGTGCFWPERLVVNSGSVQWKTRSKFLKEKSGVWFLWCNIWEAYMASRRRLLNRQLVIQRLWIPSRDLGWRRKPMSY